MKEIERLIVDYFEAAGADVVEDGLEWFLSLYDEGPSISLTALAIALSSTDRGAPRDFAVRAPGRWDMTLDWIRKNYRVPAKRGGRVEYTGNGRPELGTICGANGSRLSIRLDGVRHAMPFHPRWRLRYLYAPALPKEEEPCPYCAGVYTGLPGGACENCMNTGLKYPRATEGANDTH